MKVKVKYHGDVLPIEKITKGDWVDLRASEDIVMQANTFKLIPLGVSMKLPRGYEAHVIPRSSTFKRWGIIQTNHFGLIDNSYCGDGDVWMFPAYSTRDVVIEKNSRICQFRIQKKMKKIKFKTVEHLDATNRGGFGSSGVK